MSSVLRVGVVGVGVMGADHATRLATRVAGGTLTVVADPALDRATELAEGLGARAVADPMELIAADDVDAVLLASPDRFHEEQLLACLAAGKPVLCEKPLTHDIASALRVVRAEQELVAAGGRPLVQVGFMRRFDPEYAEVRATIESGELGPILLLHNVHRNKSAQIARSPQAASEDAVTGSLVHEVDVTRFLFGEEIVAVQVMAGRPTSRVPEGVLDPQVSVFHLAGGGIATTEVFISSQLGYEVRAEAVCESGTMTVGAGHGLQRRASGSLARAIPDDYRGRFASAYDREVGAWVDATRRGEHVGPTAWDGYAAAAVTEAGLTSLREDGTRVPVVLEPQILTTADESTTRSPR